MQDEGRESQGAPGGDAGRPSVTGEGASSSGPDGLGLENCPP